MRGHISRQIELKSYIETNKTKWSIMSLCLLRLFVNDEEMRRNGRSFYRILSVYRISSNFPRDTMKVVFMVNFNFEILKLCVL